MTVRSWPARYGVAPRAPLVGLTAIVVVAFVAYATLARVADSPRAFIDELLYFDSAASLVEGDGLTVRGERYSFAPLYPLLLAPIVWIAPDREAAYEIAKALNALLFAATAVPVFLIARRLLSPWPSVVVAGLSVAVPSAMYVSVAMTESLAYFVASWALLAIVLALERPTVLRQLVAIGAICVASAARPQFVALYGAFVTALALVTVLERKRRVSSVESNFTLWPTALSLVLVAGSFALHVLLSDGPASTTFGGYSALWRSYDPIEVAKYFLFELANLELYVGVVPFVVAPIVVASLLARDGQRRHVAFAAAFLTVNAASLLLVASFDSHDFQFLHDRYLFYVVPLWLTVLVAWLVAGAPRPYIALALGVAIAFVAPLFQPLAFDPQLQPGRQHINSMASTVWSGVDHLVAETWVASGRGVLFAFTIVLVIAAILLPRRVLWLLPASMLAVFLVTAEVGRYWARRDTGPLVAAVPAGERRWVDERVQHGRRVTLLVSPAACSGWARQSRAFYLTEFFNSAVEQVAHVGNAPDSLPHAPVKIARTGLVIRRSGGPLRADLVVAQPGIRIKGRRIGEGTQARLVLWEVGGLVQAVGVRSILDFQGTICRRSQP